MNKKQSILYINYAPYGNSGNILTYMRETFQTVIYIEFIFHHLGKTQTAIYHYKNGSLIKVEPILQIPMPSKFVFIALPIRSCINFLQIIYHAIRLQKTYHIFDMFFSVNAFISWCGNILKKIGVVRKTIFWVWDYYPPVHKNKTIMLMRAIYWQFDKIAMTSDNVVFVNNRLIKLRQNIHVLPKDGHAYPVVGIGTTASTIIKKPSKPIVFAFYGAIKKSQGLDFMFDHSEEIMKTIPKCSLHIIGSGLDETYFRAKAKNSSLPCTFYGYIQDAAAVSDILSSCTIGIALYKPEIDNVSYFGDPAKIKAYISQGLPVIATDIFEFSKELQQWKAGIVIRYNNIEDFKNAVKTVQKNFEEFSSNAHTLARQYHFASIYKRLFFFPTDE